MDIEKLQQLGASTFHSGIDIAAPEGTKLIASIKGTIVKTGWGGAGGYTITIKNDTYTVSYGHCSPDFKVEVGDEVKKGDVIGTVGPKNVYGVANNPYVDSAGKPTNRSNDRMPLPFYCTKRRKINKSRNSIRKGG